MNYERLSKLANEFYRLMESSDDWRSFADDRRRRSERAQEMLTRERIPSLSEADLRELFLDTNAFGVWSNREWRFNKRVQEVGLDGLREALLGLIERAEDGLTPEDLEQVWWVEGVLTVLLSSELLSYRYPERYWAYTETVILPALRVLGDDVKDSLPRGQKSAPYVYFAVGPRMGAVRRALEETGFADADNLLADLFLRWVQTERSSEPSIWLFQANPKYYDLAAVLRDAQVGDENGWSVTNYWNEMRAGDVIVLWQAGEDGGIYATGELLEGPYERDWEPSEEELEERPYLKAKWRVDLRYTQILGEPITRDFLKEHPVLRNLGILKFANATDFRVTPEEWAAIEELIDAPPPPQRCWKISPGEKAYAWKDFTERGTIAIGWRGFGDVRPSTPSSSDDIKGELEASGDKDGGDPSYVARQLWYLYREMQVGDAVFAYGNNQILGHGEIVGEYEFENDDFGFPHRRKVRWHNLEAFSADLLSSALHSKLWERNTINPLTAQECAEIQNLMPKTSADGGEGTPPMNVMAAIEGSLVARGFRFTPWQIATFYTALQTKGFVILSGISGTGKSKLVQLFAELLPRPRTLPEPSDEQVIITVKPYMLKYNRFVIPKMALMYFDLPSPGEGKLVEVRLEDQRQSCRLTHNRTDRGTFIELLLRGPVRKRFVERFSVGDQFVLEPRLDEEQDLVGFRLVSSEESAETHRGTEHAQQGRNTLFLSVRPDWRDSKNLLGYFNPLTGTYQWTDFLRFLLGAANSYEKRDGLAWFVILDEMNLAHVEYYFADLLSVFESGRDAEGWTYEPLRLVDEEVVPGEFPPRELYLPPNLYIVGTVNIDETTRAFSPKVLDRACSLELSDVSFTDYPVTPENNSPDLCDVEGEALLTDFTRQGMFVRLEKEATAAFVAEHPELRVLLQSLNEQLKPYGLHFGYRVFDEIVAFCDAAEVNGLFARVPEPNSPLDTAVLMKVLPKFHGARGKLEAPLKSVLAWCLDPETPDPSTIESPVQEADTTDAVISTLSSLPYRFPNTAERALRMLRDLYTEGFTAFE